MLRIDGTEGEGGGQILRTALGLSVVTGTPIQVDAIRAKRKNPGLQRQHLTAVQAAAQVGCARVEGAVLGSTSIEFAPQACNAGHYEFAIGTAGSTTLVLQTILPALWAADGPSTVRLRGGTHNPMAPTFDFLERSFARTAHRMGAGLGVELHRHGFHPAGGGELTASVSPAAWTRLDLLDAPTAQAEIRARILHSAVPASVPHREARVLCERLGLEPDRVTIEEIAADGPGNAIVCDIQLGALHEVVTSLGARNISAEQVATRAARDVRALIAAKAPVGEHLADQLLIPMALAGGGAFRTSKPSLHTHTNAAVVERFLPVSIALREDEAAGNWVVEVVAR
jgi:RNA 3'-terminal phosphate cyclase (ATP)